MGDQSTGVGAESGALPLLPCPYLVPDVDPQRIPLLGPLVMSRALPSPTILVFDSGLGGLTVLREIVRARPDAEFIYAADDALFPYGRIAEQTLIARVLGLMEGWVEQYQPDLVVIACNTASTLVLPALRQRFDLPFVGTVPAIKPACAASLSKRVSVLGTEATVRREYTKALIRQYGGGCDVVLVGSAQLASFAEAELADVPVSDDAIRAEIAPCFIDRRRPPHRHGGAGLHALSAAHRAFRETGALAGALGRPGAGDRAPRGRVGWSGDPAGMHRGSAGHLHVGPRSPRGSYIRAGPPQTCRFRARARSGLIGLRLRLRI